MGDGCICEGGWRGSADQASRWRCVGRTRVETSESSECIEVKESGLQWAARLVAALLLEFVVVMVGVGMFHQSSGSLGWPRAAILVLVLL